MAIESLFGNKAAAGDKSAEDDTPRVDANLATRQLLVRGRPADVERIRMLLEKMGEDETGEYRSQKGNIRMLPLYSGSVDDLLKRAETMWPTLRGNRIRTVTPSAAVDAMRSFRRQDSSGERRPADRPPTNPPPAPLPATEPPAAPAPPRVPAQTAVGRAAVRGSASHRWEAAANDGPFTYLAQVSPAEAAAPPPAGTLPEIIVAPGPNGLLIASEDLEALDEFEKLLETLSDPALSSPNEYTVYYLKYTKAEEAAKLLNMLINGKGTSGESGGGGGGGLAEMALGSMGGLFESATEAFSFSDNAQIVPDARINALFVRGSAADIDLIQQLLTVIDQAHSPEDVETMAPPRLIPVLHTSASEIATTVSQIYAQRLASNKAAEANQNQNRQPNVQDIMRAMRRGGGGSGGSDDASESATSEPEVTIGVDARSNSLIVSAPDPLFEQIKSLVSQLDLIAVESSETTRVVTVTRANPATIQTALSSIFGEKIQSTTADNNQTPAATAGNNPRNRPQNTNSPAQIQEQIRRRMEFFNALQRGRGGGGRGGNAPNRNRGGGQGGGGPQ